MLPFEKSSKCAYLISFSCKVEQQLIVGQHHHVLDIFIAAFIRTSIDKNSSIYYVGFISTEMYESYISEGS